MIQSIVFTLHDCVSFEQWWYISLADFVTYKNFSYLNLNVRFSCTKIYTRISLIGAKVLREITTSPHNFSVGRTISTLRKSTVGAYSTSTDSDDFNQLASFDKDSSFWVCDNSATGHICKNKALFTGERIPFIFEIGSATGTSTLTLMGTVILRIMDDEGEKHLFALYNINYLPDSPVNILSLRQLAKLYPDSSGYPDKNGTRIRSGFDSHTMFWDQEKFKKTFWTAALGLLEFLFNLG